MTNEETIGDRVRICANEIGGVTALAQETGISRGALNGYIFGRTSPQIETLELIAGIAKVTLEWLIFGGNEGGPLQKPVDPRLIDPTCGSGSLLHTAQQYVQKNEHEAAVVLPRYDIRASAGAGALVPSQAIADQFSVGREWLRRMLPGWAPPNAQVGILEGAGKNSMEPTVRDGDLLMVVQDVELQHVAMGGVFVFSLDDELKLKRLQLLSSGDLRIISDNRSYETETVVAEDLQHRVRIHGLVFFVGGKPRAMV